MVGVWEAGDVVVAVPPQPSNSIVKINRIAESKIIFFTLILLNLFHYDAPISKIPVGLAIPFFGTSTLSIGVMIIP